MRLLIVEDEVKIAKPLIRTFERQNFAVDYAEDGKEALAKAKSNDYNCILLDLNLPEIDGIEVARTLRSEGNTTPIIMLTARGEQDDRIEGFLSGTDDYVVKPFNLKELLLRVNALIKRDSVNKSEELIFANIKLLPRKNIVIINNKKEVILSNKETGVLEYLVRNNGNIISSEELLEHVWDENVDMFTDTVRTHIKTLRKKIGKETIRTIKGKGYLIDD